MNLSRPIIVLGILLGGCCNKDFIIPQDVIDYDFYEAALDVTSMMNSCSEEAFYTTIGATPDRSAGECMDNPISNRWFKFQAPATGIIYFYVHIEGSQGTQKSAMITLWDTDGVTDMECDGTFIGVSSAYVSDGDLTVGQYYYVSIDVQAAGDEGTFMICLSDSD